jgi:methylglutaconyl-CoA hydratase
MKYIQYSILRKIAIITLNRPDKKNALNGEFVEELTKAVDDIELNNEVKIVVIQAAGNVFCAGADLEYMQKMQYFSFEENLADSYNLKNLYQKIYTSGKIYIAQVEGHAIAGGAGLATVCDFVFAVPEAKYGYTEVSIGFVPAIVSFFLLRKIGECKAKELLLTGKIITADEAFKLNIFNFIEPKDKIQNAVHTFTENLIKNTSIESIKTTKQLIAEIQSMTFEDALNYAAGTNAKSKQTKDCIRGINAFMNKEKINWEN